MPELRVIGAGLGRTGTHSLKLALERLLGAPCYHMAEVFNRPQDIPIWHAAAKGERVDWRQLFAGYAAAVDWPPWRCASSAGRLVWCIRMSSGHWWSARSRG